MYKTVSYILKKIESQMRLAQNVQSDGKENPTTKTILLSKNII